MSPFRHVTDPPRAWERWPLSGFPGVQLGSRFSGSLFFLMFMTGTIVYRFGGRFGKVAFLIGIQITPSIFRFF